MKTLRKNGFSLLELMIVVAVMAIVSAIALPRFGNYLAERRLNGAAQTMMADLMMARQKAVSQNNRFTVFFTSNHGYTILDDDNNDGAITTGEAVEVKDIQKEYYDVTLSSSANPVFSPRGTAFGTTVTLTSSRTGGSRCVRVASTGRVKIDNCP